jgi:hypothetical protein
MKFINANKLHRKSGDVGHPSFAGGTRGAPSYQDKLSLGEQG